ncbi:DEAD/DEAH box helicase [Morganella morganii]
MKSHNYRLLEQEKEWFYALMQDRADNANTLEKPSMRGIQRSVVDKYSDQAHFIYELLQNADDVRATSVRFCLDQDGLYFIHNGTIHFSVSDPHSEDRNADNGTLGHINSITSIANSSKTEASIGKFGVGFKAVFQYTQTPHIYDPRICFKIERFIVPQMLNADLDWRNASDTVFFFPFDHKEKTAQDSYNEIFEKLKSLEFPVLFLSTLKSVSFTAGETTGRYTKKIVEDLEQGDIRAQKLVLKLEVGDSKAIHRLLLFKHNHASRDACTIGYAIGEDGKLEPVEHPAFCFFPTKEITHLKFILHAPFLLTDSREGIKAGEKHNQQLIQHLAKITADSLPILRDKKLLDDGIFDIIPYDESKFSELDDRRQISFKPFYSAIKTKLQTDTLLPAANANYASKNCSYWAADSELVELFSDRQLAQLTGTENASWIFRSRGKKDVQSVNKVLVDYIDGGDARVWSLREPNLIVSSLDPETVLKKITADFIASQSIEWLHRLYAYLAGRDSYQKFVKNKPIFIDQQGQAIPAFDGKNQLILFLPDDDIDGYKTVSTELLSDESTREFIEKFGIKKPSLRDEIYNKILPTYNSTSGPVNANAHFGLFFRYFKECKNEDTAEFIKLIKDNAFLLYTTAGKNEFSYGKADDIYMPSEDLQIWFTTKPETPFLLLDKYHEMFSEKDYPALKDFFKKLGIADHPKIITEERYIGWQELRDRHLLFGGGSEHKLYEKKLDGCQQIIADIDLARSLLLWKLLPQLIQQITGKHVWFYYIYRSEPYESAEQEQLRTARWILDKSGVWVSAKEITIRTLAKQYDTTSPEAKMLINFLQIRDDIHLSAEEARKIRLADTIEHSGLSEDEICIAIEEAKRKKQYSSQPIVEPCDKDQPAADSPFIRDIARRRPSVQDFHSDDPQKDDSAIADRQIDESIDTDDYTPKTVDYGKKIDRAKDRYASEIDRLEHEQTLYDKANELPRYSYGWFLALLELECLATRTKNADSKAISIGFGKVEQDEQSSRTIVLKEPSRFIPQSIEELSGIRVDLDFGNGRTGKLRIESFTAREFSLLGKLESADDLQGMALDEVVEARIEVQNPSFLQQVLLERFQELRLNETFAMKTSLTSDIEFVFGPPGTGKTTHLAEKVLIPRMKGGGKENVLVLAPTNKAADVLTSRVMEVMVGDTSYQEWLVRFGSCVDTRIENAGVWRDRTFNIGALDRSITITTIARFAYDGFTGEYGKKLYEMEWDTVVIDEASMISLANIIYPLYRTHPRKFIIAGDPFQIGPIVAVEEWKDENIYTLVGLNKRGSFAQPSTEPHDYSIVNLETQYRSIPAIGEVYSRFTYDGILQHHRTAESPCSFSFCEFDVMPINLIKFPVSKYESIYRAKRMESGTPYQAYSALFTFEFVRWLSGKIQRKNSDIIRIGVIAPYRAQANLLSKLNDSWLTKPDTVNIQIGTIHGFQGDECNIIIAVLNPPPNISNDSRIFLNKQNILNVAISRARDNLFIVIPDDETENIGNLRKVAELEKLVKANGAYYEYGSNEIEKMIWGNARYLEENTFSTGHQIVNVYRKPERYYEVRSDDSAIDIQIHEKQSESKP